MKSLALATFTAAMFWPVAHAEDAASLRQPAIDACLANSVGQGDLAALADLCACVTDGMIANIPGEDGVKVLKVLIASTRTEAETAKVLGVTPEEGRAFFDKHLPAMRKAIGDCSTSEKLS